MAKRSAGATVAEVTGEVSTDAASATLLQSIMRDNGTTTVTVTLGVGDFQAPIVAVSLCGAGDERKLEEYAWAVAARRLGKLTEEALHRARPSEMKRLAAGGRAELKKAEKRQAQRKARERSRK